jgi:oxygen-independent coproporphyrinogen III oxidase
MPDYLYIHIPFCIRKCLYCDFFSVPYSQSSAESYVDALCKELSIKRNPAQSLKAIYIGGGTPSLLPGECFTKLFQCLRDNFLFSDAAEITVEANPGTLDESKVNAMISSGVNRLSVGVQTFHDNELKLIGRIHNAEDAFRSIDLIRRTGIKNYSIDLMYGLPCQTSESWRKSLEKAVGLSPSHISTYELTLEENTPFYDLLRSFPPNEDLVLEMYNHAIDILEGSGYGHYEISNFALPGFKCLQNINYWDRGEYMGAGAGAHSFVNGVRRRNIADVSKYIDNLKAGLVPEVEPAVITPSEALKETIFLGLRKMEGLNVENLYPPDFPESDKGRNLINVAAELLDEGYMELRGEYLRLTGKGIVISNTIIVKLFEKLGL